MQPAARPGLSEGRGAAGASPAPSRHLGVARWLRGNTSHRRSPPRSLRHRPRSPVTSPPDLASAALGQSPPSNPQSQGGDTAWAGLPRALGQGCLPHPEGGTHRDLAPHADSSVPSGEPPCRVTKSASSFPTQLPGDAGTAPAPPATCQAPKAPASGSELRRGTLEKERCGVPAGGQASVASSLSVQRSHGHPFSAPHGHGTQGLRDARPGHRSCSSGREMTVLPLVSRHGLPGNLCPRPEPAAITSVPTRAMISLRHKTVNPGMRCQGQDESQGQAFVGDRGVTRQRGSFGRCSGCRR